MSEALKFHSRELYASLADCEGWRELVMPTFVDNLSRIETRILTDHERLDDRTLRALLSEQTALRRLLETLKQNARSLRPLSPGANMADAIAPDIIAAAFTLPPTFRILREDTTPATSAPPAIDTEFDPFAGPVTPQPAAPKPVPPPSPPIP
jgi:hypothetical protein